ncbi:hypothetical protein Tco_1520757, partial [Tanacetum coccineum]
VAPSQPSSSTPTVPSQSPIPTPPTITIPTPPPITIPTPPPITIPTPPPITIPTPPPITTPTSPPIPTLPTIPTPTPIPETEPQPFEHIYEEPSPVHQHFSPPQEQASSHMPMDDLLHEVPNEVSQEGEEDEGFLKRKKLVLLDSEEEEPKDQGRKSQADPQDSSVQGLVTPSSTRVKASGEEQEEDISPNTLEAAKTLSKVKTRSIDKGRSTAEGINTGSIKLSTGDEKLSTADEQLSTDDAKKSTSDQDKGQREGKAPMISEDTRKKSKEQVLQEEASLAKAIRLDNQQREEVAKHAQLDSLLAQRISEEEELNEQQKKRKAQVQFEAQHYTNEDWDLIRAKIEANAELSKSMLDKKLQGGKPEENCYKMLKMMEKKDGIRK